MNPRDTFEGRARLGEQEYLDQAPAEHAHDLVAALRNALSRYDKLTAARRSAVPARVADRHAATLSTPCELGEPIPLDDCAGGREQGEPRGAGEGFLTEHPANDDARPWTRKQQDLLIGLIAGAVVELESSGRLVHAYHVRKNLRVLRIEIAKEVKPC